MLPKVFQAFIAASPVSVMVRGTLERTLRAETLDRLFEETAEVQYVRELLFSECVHIMSDVVFRTSPSVCDWYRSHQDEMSVSRTAVYDKLAGTELNVSAEMVRRSADELAAVRWKMKSLPRPLLRGYRTRVLDGTHLDGTEHRLLELRRYRAATLPGQALLFYDPRLDLIDDVIPCEDAYTQERALTDQFLQRVKPRDAIIVDRNFCTTKILFGTAARGAFFIVRQHKSTLTWESVGQERRVGTDSKGRPIYVQKVRLTNPETKETMIVRRIRIPLKKPCRSGEKELFVLTNIPATDADAVCIADRYTDRWTIEVAIQHLKGDLRCEIDTLAYPKAALFGLCVALMAYNVVSLVKNALRVAHGKEFVEDELSMHYLTEDVARTTGGMLIAIPQRHWSVFKKMSAPALAQTLIELAARLKKHKYLKHKRGPKKKPPRKISGKRNHHVSTARLLEKRQ
ncbi:MAG: transposase [Planctomycetes bacterium]|nr:transposase [Planctomycetota bacterium]